MQFFFDTSALAKRYIRENGSDKVIGLCSKAKTIFVSILALPEIFSTLNRLRREKKIQKSHYAQAKRNILDDFKDFSVVELSPEVLTLAIELLENYPLKTLDAIQIASALAIEPNLFVSADARQITAAGKSHLKVSRV